MSDKMIEVARAVCEQFMPAEISVDMAAARTARLLATLLEGRSAAEVSLGTGAALVRKLTKSLAAQIDAREEFAMAHKLAAALPAELGLERGFYGDTTECPPDDPKRILFEDGNVVRLAAA